MDPHAIPLVQMTCVMLSPSGEQTLRTLIAWPMCVGRPVHCVLNHYSLVMYDSLLLLGVIIIVAAATAATAAVVAILHV